LASLRPAWSESQTGKLVSGVGTERTEAKTGYLEKTPTLSVHSGVASCEQAQFVLRNGKFLANCWLAAIQADQQLWKDEHERFVFVTVRQMHRNLCSELLLSF
jgi:hypothetical protein